MMRILLLTLLWADAWTPGDYSAVTTGCEDHSPPYKLEVQRSVRVQEGLCVLVPCKVLDSSQVHGTDIPKPATSTSAVSGYWFRAGADTKTACPVATNIPNIPVEKATQNRFHLLGDLKNSNCSLDIRDAQRGDGGSYFFRMEKGNFKWNYCNNHVSVQVTALTHTPHIDFPLILEPGRLVNLTCSVPWACERGTPPIFSWMSSALTSLGPRTTLSSVLTLTPRPQDHGTNLTCQVTFPGVGVTVETTIQLNVTAWMPETAAAPTEMVLGAMMGAGVTILLAACICLVFFGVKLLGRKGARTTVPMDDVHPVAGPASPDEQQDSKMHSHTETLTSPEETPIWRRENETHYASLVFHGQRPQAH